jgi:hypothetical protein
MGRHYHRSHDIGNEYARRHIEDYHRLEMELGGSIEDVKQYFLALKPQQLRVILDAYERRFGATKRAYAQQTIESWRSGKRRMSGTVAERLFALLPPRMPLTAKYQLVETLWNHVGPKSKKTLRVGLDVGIEHVLDAVRKHMEDVVVHYKIPEGLERRFNWLAAGDSQVKQDLLNHLQQYEKALVVEGARLQLPVMFAHLRGQAGQHTHRLAQVLKIGNHELELAIDKDASGVAIVEPWTARPSAITQAANYTWLWLVAAAVAVSFPYFAMSCCSRSSIFSREGAPGTETRPRKFDCLCWLIF